ncbi:MAG: hypothetical protein CVU95_00785 [Firmicutes bacterium HGW-Firmicutes-2]|jgi:hypothetical protein|nr:MAG: hypothetical protein CVU95_00785 [Firmicutes bacterium HGW-Firmicutes-2]
MNHKLVMAAWTVTIIIIMALVMVVPIEAIKVMRQTVLEYFGLTLFALVLLLFGCEVWSWRH